MKNKNTIIIEVNEQYNNFHKKKQIANTSQGIGEQDVHCENQGLM